jgi:hypothetical protein
VISRSPINEVISEAARSALTKVEVNFGLRSCIPWSIINQDIQFLQAKADGTEVIPPPLVERVVDSLAMFHPNETLRPDEGQPIKALGCFFSFLKALPDVGVTNFLIVTLINAVGRRP